MTTRLEILDIVDRALTEHLGSERVTRRDDGVVIVAGNTEAYAVLAMTIDAPDFANPDEFGKDLVEYIRSHQQSAGEPGSWHREGGRGIGKTK